MKNNQKIDINKLQGVVRQSDSSIICMCPMCAQEGRDLRGKNHLRVWSNGAFNCIVNPNDKVHNAGILALVGTNDDSERAEEYVPPEPKIEIDKKWSPDILKGLIRDHTYWNKRGISNETMDYFRAGVAYRGQMRNRSVIPIFDKQANSIIGFTGRALKADMSPKWKHLAGDKTKWLMPAIDEEIKKLDMVILVESPGCFLSLFEHGIKNTICLFGLNISSKIIGYIIKINPKKIIIATNNEPENRHNIGLKSAFKIKNQLLQFFNEERVIIYLPTKKDFNELSKQEIKEWFHSVSKL